MNKITLEFTAEGQNLLNVTDGAKFASNTVNYIDAVFDLGDGWPGFDAVRAVWFSDYASIATVLDFDGHCVVPHEVLNRKGKVRVNLVGSVSEDDVLTDRLTTYPTNALTVSANARVDGDNSEAITSSQFEQYVEAVRVMVDNVPEYSFTVANETMIISEV